MVPLRAQIPGRLPGAGGHWKLPSIEPVGELVGDLEDDWESNEWRVLDTLHFRIRYPAFPGKTPISSYRCDHGTLPAGMKPDLMGHAAVLDEAREAVNPGRRTIQGVEEVRLDTSFEPRNMKSSKDL